MVNQDKIKLYPSFIDIYLFIFIFSALGFLLLRLFDEGIYQIISVLDISAVIIISLLSIPIAVFIVRKFPIIIDNKGITGYSTLGGSKYITWSKIEYVIPQKVANLYYLKLYYHPLKSPVWLFLSNKSKFKDIIADLTPPENCLSAFVKIIK